MSPKAWICTELDEECFSRVTKDNVGIIHAHGKLDSNKVTTVLYEDRKTGLVYDISDHFLQIAELEHREQVLAFLEAHNIVHFAHVTKFIVGLN